MRKRIVAAGLIAGILLTGCGAPDVIKDEAKKAAADCPFLSSEEEIQEALKAVGEKKDSGPKEISVFQRQCLKNLEEAIQKDSFLKARYGENDDVEIEDDSGADYIEVDESEEPSLHNWIQPDKKKQEEIFSWNMEVPFTIKNGDGKDLDGILSRLEKLGFEGLRGYSPGQYGNIAFVRKGMLFRVVEEEEYQEDGSVKRELLEVDVRVPEARYYYPKKYEEIIEKSIVDGFFLTNLHTGGYADCLMLQGSWNDPVNPYNKQMMFYLKDGKPLQLEIKIWENREKAEGLVFSAYEKQTVTNLLRYMTGNSSEAAAFVSNFRTDGDTEGKLGDKTWRLIGNGKTKNKSSYILRIQQEK